jgi:hypothetical protein
MIAALKIIAIVATALFGVFGSIVNFRDQNGRLTRSGWIGLTGVLLSGLLAAGLQVYSDQQQENSTLSILKNIERNLSPLNDLAITTNLSPNWEKAPYHEYVNTIEDYYRTKFQNETSIGGLLYDINNISLFQYTILEMVPHFYFYKTPIDPSKFSYSVDTSSGANLHLEATSACRFLAFMTLLKNERGDFVDANNCRWEAELKDGKLIRAEMVTKTEPSKVTIVDNDATIYSIQDLLESQLIIYLDDGGGYPIDKNFPREKIQAARQLVTLVSTIIALPNGISMQFDSDNLKSFVSKSGYAAYSFTYPKTIKELIEATHVHKFKHLL